jgi:uncharacterized surface protein with fasciclin (FAS1) repeats
MTSITKPIAALALSAFVLTACGSSSDETPGPTQNIVQIAQANPDFSILVEAVVAADLVGTLSGPGPFTVFAPNNAAFGALLTELDVTKEELLANKGLLTAVLTYHVLDIKVLKSQIPLGKAISPLGGGFFKIYAEGSAVKIQDGRNRTGNVVATDVQATNGVVHVLDRVILPPNKNIVDTAVALASATPAEFTILVEAVLTAGLADALSGPGTFTVFAPTDAAFAALLAELGVTKDELFANTALLTEVLTYHVIAGRVLKADVVPGDQPATLQGEFFSISSSLVITDKRARTANIVGTDVFTSNGVIHVLDKVILPAPPAPPAP